MREIECFNPFPSDLCVLQRFQSTEGPNEIKAFSLPIDCFLTSAPINKGLVFQLLLSSPWCVISCQPCLFGVHDGRSSTIQRLGWSWAGHASVQFVRPNTVTVSKPDISPSCRGQNPMFICAHFFTKGIQVRNTILAAAVLAGASLLSVAQGGTLIPVPRCPEAPRCS